MEDVQNLHTSSMSQTFEADGSENDTEIGVRGKLEPNNDQLRVVQRDAWVRLFEELSCR